VKERLVDHVRLFYIGVGVMQIHDFETIQMSGKDQPHVHRPSRG
jgi:hypothetical protein